jgi:acetyl/propionyl-CoA carboxylase alpha subunit
MDNLERAVAAVPRDDAGLGAGVDMVRAQILVAAGEPLPWSESPLTQRGHAIEARIYAEDPSRDFLPQAGRLLLYREPRIPGVRIDSGIREGDDVTVDYDPLLAKVIAYAETRQLATARLTAALRDFPILGIATNIPFLLTVLAHERFTAGTLDTRFLDGEGAWLAHSVNVAERVPEVVAAAVAMHGGERHAPAASRSSSWDPWLKLRGWR